MLQHKHIQEHRMLLQLTGSYILHTNTTNFHENGDSASRTWKGKQNGINLGPWSINIETETATYDPTLGRRGCEGYQINSERVAEEEDEEEEEQRRRRDGNGMEQRKLNIKKNREYIYSRIDYIGCDGCFGLTLKKFRSPSRYFVPYRRIHRVQECFSYYHIYNVFIYTRVAWTRNYSEERWKIQAFRVWWA